MKCPSSRSSLALVAVAWMILSNAGCHRRAKVSPPAPAPTPAPASAPAPAPPTVEEHSPPRTEPAKPPAPAPELGPSITPQERAQAEQTANDLMNRTENNLRRADGKSLNATQKDLLERSRAFLKQAQAAARAGDWARASNLAQKAYLLSDDLSRSIP